MYKNRLALIIPLLIGCNLPSFAATHAMQYKADLQEVTVFLKGAELYSQKTISIPAGESEVILTNIADNLNPQTLALSATDGVVILSQKKVSYTPESDTQDDAVTTEISRLKTLLNLDETLLETVNLQINFINNSLTSLSKANPPIQGNALAENTQYIATAMPPLLTQKRDLTQAISSQRQAIQALEKAASTQRAQSEKSVPAIALTLYSDKAVETTLNINYAVNNAGWIPHYDLYVKDQKSPIDLAYKANIYQDSGINWEGVNLTLSTGNPSLGATLPALSSWYINSYEAPAVILESASYRDSEHAYMMLEKSSDVLPVVSPRSTTKSSSRQSNALTDYVTVDAGDINVSYRIALPYTIPSDRKTHTVFVNNTKVNSEYQYILTPELDSDAFLVAKISEFKDLNLLPGNTTIYYQNAFVGEGKIPRIDQNQSFEISLGRDKRITATRQADKNQSSSTGIFGNDREKSYGYQLNVQNNSPEAQKIVIRDRMPILQDKRITFSQVKLDGATKEDSSGILSWELQLEPQSQKTIEYSYKVRYPKDLNVSGL